MPTLAIFNTKGGVGKTATAVNLAYIAAQSGAPTLLCDLDPQGSATFYFRVVPHVQAGAQVITKGGKHLVRSIKETDYEGLDLLPSDISYRHFSFALDKVKRSRQRLQESLAPLQALYTYIVLDCPPTSSLLAESMLTAADHVLIPVVPTTLSMRAYAQLLAFSEDSHCGDRPITAFFSMVERSKSLHRTVMQETLGHDHRFLQSVIPYAANIEGMGLRREPVGASAPRSPGALAYMALWQELQSRLPPSTPTPALDFDALQRPAALTFQPAPSFDANRLASDLHAVYPVRTEPKTHRHVTYFDTFDWRLYHQSLTLQWEAPHLRLHALSDDCQHDCQMLTTAPTRAADLPSGALRQRLEKATDSRALLSLFDCTSEYDTWRLLNADDKTVVRLVIERHTCANPQGSAPALTRVCLKPLKGYPQDAKHVQQWLLARGLIPSPTPLYASALAALDITPPGNAKPQFHLAPDMRADAAMRSMLQCLFSIMRQNEAGILNDIDTEFLHDFRVACRRARSAVGQLKGVFDEPTTQRLKQDLASLGTMTNQVRDLDVHLLRQSAYRAKLPDNHRDAIEPLFDLLQRDRKQAFRHLKRKLRAKTYAALMTRWETFLNAEPSQSASETAPNAARPIRQLARKRLAKLSDRVIESGSLLLTDEHDERMHKLRIDCKKLRYMLEFTSNLFPQPAVALVLKHLRKLQDGLGHFHDCCTQQETFATYAEHFHATNADATQQAIVHLIEILEQEKQTCKAAFAEHFTIFAASVEGKLRPWKRKR